MNEGATSGFPYIAEAASALPHTYLTLSGGAIGQGMPCATGVAVACPDRPVINIQADGSGMYTLQSLWTQAREHLNVTTILCSNRAYRILQIEFFRSGIKEPGPKARAMMDLSDPSLDWVQLANGMGVPAVSVDSVETLTVAFQRALAEPGPNLIEVLL
jgi:acetolactate synthase-1/2/3 large subunit